MKEFTLEVDGITLCGQLYLPPGKDRCPVVCICHGIPARIPDPTDQGYPVLAETVCNQGFAVVLFNFRGTGKSGGNLDILGWTRDLSAIIDYISTEPEVDSSRLALFGFSGGAAVSVYVSAQDRRVSYVAACACPADFDFFTRIDKPQSLVDHFRAIGAIRDEGFPSSLDEWLSGFDVVRPIDYVAGISPRPLLLVHGSRDGTVNISHAYRLFERAGEPRYLFVIEGAEHRLRQNATAVTTVIDWLKSKAG